MKGFSRSPEATNMAKHIYEMKTPSALTVTNLPFLCEYELGKECQDSEYLRRQKLTGMISR